MLPVCPVILPLFTAALLAALTKLISQRLSQAIAIAATVATLGCNLWLMNASAAAPIVYWFGNWRPRDGIALGICFAVDPIGAGLAAFATFLTLAAFIFSAKYFDAVGNHFHALLLAFLAAMCGFSLTGDLFNMFVFFELMSAAAFALCAYKTEDPGSLQGGFNFAVMNAIAAYFVLTGIALLYARTGALNMAQMSRVLDSRLPDSLVIAGFVFIVCGYLVKAAVVPFHFWLADAHAVAPTPVCILFSGVMIQMGLLAFARTYFAIFHHSFAAHLEALTNLFVTAGVITAVVGSFMCYLQRNIKRLLAFSTIAHLGIMMMGISLFSAEGLAGAAIYTLGHGVVKASLFLVAGILLHRFKTVDEWDLYAKGRGHPCTAVVYFVSGIALAGIPYSGLASGVDLIHAAAKATGFDGLRWISMGAGAVTSAAVLRAGVRIFLGWGPKTDRGAAPKQEESPETDEGHSHTPFTMFLPAAVLAAIGIVLGLVPKLQVAALHAAAQFTDTAAYASRVLDGRILPIASIAHAPPADLAGGFAAVLIAIAIAAAHLFSPTIRALSNIAIKPLHWLHKIHSGHIGDYVTFLTFGMACFGLICVYCLQ
ncbi:MAG TPA: proton-conducting transporter membrane subunit [Bryobacteraceae bacterium]|nr:proton-conducting transporter membrane subunit [Bryobacteraceae bacterium]